MALKEENKNVFLIIFRRLTHFTHILLIQTHTLKQEKKEKYNIIKKIHREMKTN
jgi:hypothetical protein